MVIGNSVTTIGEWAFENCDKLTSVVIGNSVTSIGECAFSRCTKLVEIINYSSLNITKGSEDYGGVGRNALNVKTSGTTDIVNKNGYLFLTVDNVNYLVNYIGTDINLVLPDSYNGQSYQINKCVFYICRGLTSVVIPDSVTSIGDAAFDGCSGLTSVVIGNSVTSIGDAAFDGCSGLTSVVIPDSVTSIGKSAFSVCSGLTSVVIPDSVTSIGKSAFSRCYGLTSVVIPDSVTSIGDAFSGCSNLQYNEYDNAYYLGNENNPYVALIKAKNTSISSCIINNQTKVISGYSFEDCSLLTSVVIPDSVTSIGDSAF